MWLSLRGRPERAQALRTVHAALDGGMTLLDTADAYCQDDGDIGHNEELLAEGVRTWPGRAEIVIATKGGLQRPGGRWTRSAHPDHLRRACEHSLRALGVDVIDLYQLHAPDPAVPFSESVGALRDLQEAGKIRHVGLSNVSDAQLLAALRVVDVVSVQNRCNPVDVRAFRDGVIARCEERGLAFLPYSPLGGSGHAEHTGAHAALKRVADRLECSPYQVALAWLLAASPAMIPIPGSSRPETAASSAAAMDLELAPEDKSELDAAFLG